MSTLCKKWKRVDATFKDKHGFHNALIWHDSSLAEVYQGAIDCGFTPDPWWKIWGNNHVYVSCLETKDKNGAGYAEYELFDQDTFERIM